MRDAWATAFYEQASSDWDVYEQLSRLQVPQCHSLHYLQMATEKLAKAYRLRVKDSDVDSVMTHHVALEAFINNFVRSPAFMRDFDGKDAQHREVCRTSKAIAREIEKLAPAVDRKQTPDNAEYPWEHGGEVFVPCDYSFPRLSLLKKAGGRAFLNLIERAFRDYQA